jgi:hypothetical protein
MTEDEWLSDEHLPAKIRFLGERFSFRKARLFAVACGRVVAARRDHPAVRTLLDSLEAVADYPRRADRTRLYEEFREVAGLVPTGLFNADEFAAGAVEWAVAAPADRVMSSSAAVCADAEYQSVMEDRPGRFHDVARRHAMEQAVLRQYSRFLHDIVGNPFRPVRWDQAWQTLDVRGIARGIYADRAFDRLPLLADALLDAGCDDDTIIGHCRGDGPHVRGCWVVDRVLGKR